MQQTSATNIKQTIPMNKTKNIKPIIYKVRIPSVTEEKLKSFLTNLQESYLEIGICSFYHDKFNRRQTATGDRFFQNKWTCAHKTLPIPCVVLILFLHQNKLKGLKLLVNDRGPFIHGRILDVSKNIAYSMNLQQIGCKRILLFFLPKDTVTLMKEKKFMPVKKLLNNLQINTILANNNINLKF